MPPGVDGDRERQLKSYRQAVERSEEVRKAVAEVFCGAGVYTIWWPYYFIIARSLTKLASRPVSYEILLLEARTQLEVWVDRGLERHVLTAIGADVFNLSLTGPIQPLAGSPGPT
jgi:hypothetical protein